MFVVDTRQVFMADYIYMALHACQAFTVDTCQVSMATATLIIGVGQYLISILPVAMANYPLKGEKHFYQVKSCVTFSSEGKSEGVGTRILWQERDFTRALAEYYFLELQILSKLWYNSTAL